MATFARSAINEFSTANPAYIGATISIFLADSDGGKTSTLATLYEAPTGSNTLPNPQTLDSTGKLIRPVYIEQNVVIEASLGGVPSHDTGLIQVPMVNSYEVYTFDGDGTTTDFNLANVSVEAPNSLEVVLDGAQQEVDADYSWDFDTKTLTFSTPPSNNVRIVVVDRGLLRDLNQPSGGSVNLNSLAQDALDRLDEFLEKGENLADLDDLPTALGNLTAQATGILLFQSETPVEARDELELGTAATEDIQTSPDDATAGRVVLTNAYGKTENRIATYEEIDGSPRLDMPAMPYVDGVPIVESGSNSDGEWMKWADGTQTTRSRISFTQESSSTLSSTWVFPIAFDTASGLIGLLTLNEDSNQWSADRNSVSYYGVRSRSSMQMLFVIRGVNFSSGQVANNQYVMAVGQWK